MSRRTWGLLHDGGGEGFYQMEAVMAKNTDSAVSLTGKYQNAVTLVSEATAKQGGSLGDALELLGKPEYSGEVDSLAAILARVCKQHQAKLEAAERVKVVNKTTLLVNLASDPKLPFDGTTVKHNAGGGWVKVEKRKDGHLYVNGKKVVLHLEDSQKAGVVGGHKLREALTGKATLHPNIMDALCDYAPHMIPEYCKQDSQGRTLYICFWEVIYGRAGGGLYVRCLYWDDGAWRRDCYWLGDGFGVQDPAAVSASNS